MQLPFSNLILDKIMTRRPALLLATISRHGLSWCGSPHHGHPLSLCVSSAASVYSEQFSRSELAAQVPVSTGLYIG